MSLTVIENISHTFFNKGASIKVIDEFSLTLKSGETVAILGPSGCGKSTILRCIASILKPTVGKVTVNQKKSETALKEKMIGFAFQEAALLDWATVEDNILLPGRIGLKTVDSSLLSQRVKELIGLMGLIGFEKFYPMQLSGGMKQRVALARALLLHPSLLLLDEPFGSLDLLTRSNLIVEFNKILNNLNIPAIIVTHSIEEAVFLADKVLILSPRPCKIIAEIYPELGKDKSFDLFDRVDFVTKVAECRKVLIENWSSNEK